MSQDVINSTGKLSDAQIVRLFEDLRSKFSVDRIAFQHANISVDLDAVKSVLGKNRSFFISGVNCTIENGKFSIVYARGLSTFIATQNQFNTSTRTPSAYFDEIIVTPSRNTNGSPAQPTIEEVAKLEAVLRQHIILKLPTDLETAGGSAIDLLQRELAGLSELHTRLLTDAIELRQSTSKEYDDKLADLAERERQSLEKIEAQRQKNEQELAAQKETLDAKQKELDDRNHMHVRRALREQITSDIQTRVKGALLSSRSQWLARGVFALSLLCALASALFSYWSYEAFAQVLAQPSEALNGREWALLVLGIRTTLAVIAAIGFLVYALTWLRRTYDEDVKLNNDLHRYALDLNRASWIIETVMEMSAKEGQTPPEKWVDGVTHGMFQSHGQADDGVTPLEALGTLLNVTARAEVGPGGTKLEFDGKNLRKIAKSGESAK